LITAGEDRSDEHYKASDDRKKGHEPDDKSDFVEDGIDRVENEGEVDDGDVWVSADDCALHGGRLFAGSHASGDDVETGSIFQNAAGENDEEIWLDAFPIDFANTDDAIGHENALDIEDQFVAEIDFEVFGDACLDGDRNEIRVGDFDGPGAFDELFAGIERIAISGTILAAESPAREIAAGFAEKAADWFALERSEAHGDERDVIEDGKILFAEDLFYRGDLVGLDIEESSVRLRAAIFGDESARENLVGAIESEDEKYAEAEGE